MATRSARFWVCALRIGGLTISGFISTTAPLTWSMGAGSSCRIFQPMCAPSRTVSARSGLAATRRETGCSCLACRYFIRCGRARMRLRLLRGSRWITRRISSFQVLRSRWSIMSSDGTVRLSCRRTVMRITIIMTKCGVIMRRQTVRVKPVWRNICGSLQTRWSVGRITRRSSYWSTGTGGSTARVSRIRSGIWYCQCHIVCLTRWQSSLE